MKTKTIRVTGRVQGVGFRWTTQALARELGICGRVRNENDGSVTITYQAGQEAENRFLTRLCSGSQNPFAQVADIQLVEESDQAPMSGFTVSS